VNPPAQPRLTVDLRIDPRPDHEPSANHEYLAFHEIAAAAKRPRSLGRMLRSRRYETVDVIGDAIPPSGVQASAEVLLGMIRTRTFRLENGLGTREMRRPAFVVRALMRAARAAPTELVRTAVLSQLTRRAAGRDYRLTRNKQRPATVTYLRTEPTLHWMGTYVGGAATHTTGVINGFAANGVDVRVLAPERPDGIEGAAVDTVPLERIYHLVVGLTYSDYSRAIVRAASSAPSDFVYQRYALGSFAGLELARRWGVPLVLEFNGSDVWVMEHWGPRKPRLLKTLAALERRNLSDASLVVVVSDVLKEQVVELGVPEDHVLVNPNGVDVDQLAPLRARSAADWRTATGQQEALTIGFIGTWGPWHGVKVLPEIIERVAGPCPEARWILIGDGHLHAEVTEEIVARGLSDKVTLTGLVEHEHALELLAASDICVSPHVPNPDGTRFFGSPTKLFEYMGLGKPIVASDLEQIGEVIKHGHTGLLCPPGDAAAAAAAVLRLTDDSELRARLGAGALEDAKTTFSWAAHTSRILAALEGRQVPLLEGVKRSPLRPRRPEQPAGGA
jgi:glycosyltransferase involved in cell wall biosynthesis